MAKKIVLIIIFFALFLAGLSYGIQQWIILPSFYQLERELAIKDLNRVLDAIEQETNHLTNVTNTFSSWIDTYKFAEDGNQSYIKNNFGMTVMQITQIHLFQIYDRAGKKIKEEIFDPLYLKNITLSLFDRQLLPRHDNFFQAQPEDLLQGIVLSEYGPLMLSALPILKDDGSGPVNGTLIMGRFISQDIIRRLSKQTKISFFVEPVEKNKIHSPPASNQEKDKELITTNKHVLIAHGLLRDIFNQPALKIHANIPRDITMHGIDASTLTSMTILLSLLLLGTTLLTLFCVYNTKIKKVNQEIKKEVDYRTFQLRLAKDDAEQAKDEAELSREQAIKANRARGDFLANMSHEIRTPMNAILGMSYLCQRTELSAKQARYINNIHHTASSLLGLLNSILDFSKIDAGKMELEITDFTLDDCLSYLDRLTFESVREKDVPLIFDVQAKLPFMLKGDLLRLGQVALNLVQNSLKFTERGAIYVTVKLVEQTQQQVSLIITVEDTGIGMSEESAEHIFDEFIQADPSTTRQYGGTGLGLSISRQLILLMGGKISLSSELGKGTQITVELSFEKSNHSNREVCDALAGKQIIIIASDNKLALAITHTLASYGANIERFNTFTSALTHISNGNILLINEHFRAQDIRDFLSLLRQKNLRTTNILLSNQAELPEALAQEKLAILSKAVHLSSFCLAADIGMIAQQLKTEQALHRNKIVSLEDNLRGKRILLAEDNAMNRQIIVELLSDVGINVILAENGLQAIELLSEHKVDAILMDIQMPVMDGIEATKQIRRQTQWQAIPIIALTASAMRGDKEKGLAIGMSDYLTKPVFSDKLYQSLIRWCGEFPTQAKMSAAAPPKVPGSFDGTNTDILPATHQTAPEPVTAAPAEFSRQILDIEAGLKVCAGKQHLLNSLWQQFSDKHGDSIQRLKNLLENGDIKQACALLHNLKGIAGNIGALTLARQVADLYRQLTLSPGDMDKNQLENMAKQLQQVLEAINKQLQEKPPLP
ncbi:response regulator [Thalassomonas actiniarum]|uniref:Sensory/regulatory protein RpfC n=1 Tax=Thalassomonas actiniarum TaxID=485447 RepID=A0AAE9YSL5_9GAMM|nr:response regulator [Thalassomonas actiniarum]WDE00082.1 response regulator [Thalassomonas actiniarum]